MTILSTLPLECKALLEAHPGLPTLPVLVRRSKEIENEIEEAVAKLGMCIYIMPILPRRITTGADFVFVEDGEVRVRLCSNPTIEELAIDVYEAMAQVTLCLHGTNPGGLLADNLRLSGSPVELIEDPEAVIFDILFTAAFQLNT